MEPDSLAFLVRLRYDISGYLSYVTTAVNEPPIYRLVSLPAASHRSSPSEYLSDFGAGFGEVVYIHLAEINFYVFPGAEVYIPVCSPCD